MEMNKSVQSLARADDEENKPIINKIESIIFTANKTPYTDDQLKRPAPFSHVQNIVGKLTESMNSVIDTLNTTLKAEQTKVATLISNVGNEDEGLIKNIRDLQTSLEPPPMDAPGFI